MKLFLTTLLCVVSMCCFSQNEGYVIIGQDQRIEELIQKQKEIHSIDNTIDGFRVQIFMESGNDAVEHANAVMEEFKVNYPDIPIYLVFGQPYYRLRVGDFRTRLEAEKMFQTLSQEYKKAFVTSDRIQLPYNIFSDTSLDVNLEDIDNDLDTIQNDTILSTDNIYYQY